MGVVLPGNLLQELLTLFFKKWRACKYEIRPMLFSVKSIYLRTAKFISKHVVFLYRSMIPCPPYVVAPKSQLGQPWDAYTPTYFPERLVESIIGHAFTIFVHNSGYTELFRDKFYGRSTFLFQQFLAQCHPYSYLHLFHSFSQPQVWT